MTKELELWMLESRISTLNVVIHALQEGIDQNLPWVKSTTDTREYELRDFIAQRDALVDYKNTIELEQ